MIENEPTFDLPNNIIENNNNNLINDSNQNNKNNGNINDIYSSSPRIPKKIKQNNLAHTSLNYIHKHPNNNNINALDLNSQIYQAFYLNPIFEPRRKKRRSSTYLSTVCVNTNSNTLNNNNANDISKKRNSLYNNNNKNVQNNNLVNANNKKKKKSVRFSDPFIIDIPIESLKEFNLKMTYDYEQVPDLMISDKICPCKMCLIF
jgi:hypothetical protein